MLKSNKDKNKLVFPYLPDSYLVIEKENILTRGRGEHFKVNK